MNASHDHNDREHNEPCSSCDGKGYIPGFSHIAGGLCFACGGTGLERVRPMKRERVNVTVAQRTLLETASETQIRAMNDRTLSELCLLASALANNGELPRERHTAFGKVASERSRAKAIARYKARGDWPSPRQIRFLETATRAQLASADDGQKARIFNAALTLHDCKRLSGERYTFVKEAVTADDYL